MLRLIKHPKGDFAPGNLEARIAAGVGGSDAPVICGEDPYNTPIRAAAIYSGQFKREENACMWWGHQKEPAMLALARRDGIQAQRVNHVLVHHNPERSFMYAHLDGRVLKTDQIIECKLVSDRMRHHWGTPGTDQIPPWVYVQCQHNMDVTRAKSCLVIALFGGNDQQYYRVTHNQAVCEQIAALEKAWLEKVQNKEPLEPLDRDDLLLLHGKGEGRSVSANDDIFSKITARENIRQKIKDLEQEKQDLELKICSYMGAAHFLTYGKERVVSLTPSNARAGRSLRINSRRLKAAMQGGLENVPN